MDGIPDHKGRGYETDLLHSGVVVRIIRCFQYQTSCLHFGVDRAFSVFGGVVVLMLMLLACGLQHQGFCREWSDPLQLTETYGNSMNHRYSMVQDQEGSIHVLYELEVANEERPAGIYYAKYDINGNPLIDPFRPLDNNGFGRSTLLANEDGLHIFGSRGQNYYHCRLDLSGEYLLEPHLVEGFYEPIPDGFSYPWVLDLRSDGSIVGVAAFGYDNEYSGIIFANLSPEGQLNDSIRFISEIELPMCLYPHISVDEEDNVHVLWRYGYGGELVPKYAKVSADDSLLIPERILPPLNDGGQAICVQIEADGAGHLYMLFVEGSYRFMRKTDLEGETIWDTELFRDRFYGGARTFTIQPDNLFLAISIQDPDDQRGRLAFMSADTAGNIIDSLTYYHSFPPAHGYGTSRAIPK